MAEEILTVEIGLTMGRANIFPEVTREISAGDLVRQ
jgi:hypothetical protein